LGGAFSRSSFVFELLLGIREAAGWGTRKVESKGTSFLLFGKNSGPEKGAEKGWENAVLTFPGKHDPSDPRLRRKGGEWGEYGAAGGVVCEKFERAIFPGDVLADEGGFKKAIRDLYKEEPRNTGKDLGKFVA